MCEEYQQATIRLYMLITNANIETRKIHHSKGCLCKKRPGAKSLANGVLGHYEMGGR